MEITKKILITIKIKKTDGIVTCSPECKFVYAGNDFAECELYHKDISGEKVGSLIRLPECLTDFGV